MFRVGQLVGDDFEILDLLGSGGMGFVFRARQRSLDRIVCLKVPREEIRADEAAMQRFEREAKTVARLNHPNIVAIHIVHLPDSKEDTPYIAMEFIEGKELEDYLFSNRSRLTVGDFLHIFQQICDGLHAAHEANIVHRDIKPANILVSAGRNLVKVMDFGIARVQSLADTATSTMVVGTPAFMSPEQVRGEKPTPSSDIYALGAVLYVLCAQRPLFEGTATTVAIKQMTEMPPNVRDFNVAVPAELDKVIMRSLSKDPSKRPVTAHELSEELGRVLTPLAHQPLRSLIPDATDATNALATAAQGVTWVDPRAKKRDQMTLLACGVLGLLLLVGFFWQFGVREMMAQGAAERLRSAALASASQGRLDAALYREAVSAQVEVLRCAVPAWLGFLSRDAAAVAGLESLAGALDAPERWKIMGQDWDDTLREFAGTAPDSRRRVADLFKGSEGALVQWKGVAASDSELRAYSRGFEQRKLLALRLRDAEMSLASAKKSLANAEMSQALKDLTATRNSIAALQPLLPTGDPFLHTLEKGVESLMETQRRADAERKAREEADARARTEAERRARAEAEARARSQSQPVVPSQTPGEVAVAQPTPEPSTGGSTGLLTLPDVSATVSPEPTPSPLPVLDQRVANEIMAEFDKALLEGPSAMFFALRFVDPATSGQYKDFLARLAKKYEVREAKHSMTDFRIEGDRGVWTGQVVLRGRMLANRVPTTIANVQKVTFTLVWNQNQWQILDTDFPFEKVQ